VYAYLTLLAALPDTLIARKLGRAEAERISRRAAEVRRGGPRELTAFDRELRDERNTRNPGTTADLTCASIFAVILEDGWNR
jgi:triphosphoribosyl-dephospho-CoA synthase